MEVIKVIFQSNKVINAVATQQEGFRIDSFPFLSLVTWPVCVPASTPAILPRLPHYGYRAPPFLLLHDGRNDRNELMAVRPQFGCISGSGQVCVFDRFSLKLTSNIISHGTLGLNNATMQFLFYFHKFHL